MANFNYYINTTTTIEKVSFGREKHIVSGSMTVLVKEDTLLFDLWSDPEFQMVGSIPN